MTMVARASSKILFCGDMRTPFIRQDYELIKEISSETGLIDYSHVAAEVRHLPRYLVQVFTKILPGVLGHDICWIWFADYPALPMLLFSKFLGKYTVINVGEWEVTAFPEIDWGCQLRRTRGWIVRWLLRNADVIVVPSESFAGITKKTEPRTHRICVIPNYIDTALCDIDLPRKEPHVITTYCADGMDKRKGLDTFRTVAQSGLPYQFDAYRRIPREQMINEMKRSKVFCQLSYTESFGITLVEAMACGCIPVVTDRGALPWVVGDTGIIVPYGDVEKTRAAVETAMLMEGTPARERARTFSRERKRERVKKLLKELT
jgi:glycosyltransferase involved in cell wall biosynthesis